MVGLFRLDRRQVAFDAALLVNPNGAVAKYYPYRITGIRYEGVSLAAGFNARWQQGYLYNLLKAGGVSPGLQSEG